VINLTISFSDLPHLPKKVDGFSLFNFIVYFGKPIKSFLKKITPTTFLRRWGRSKKEIVKLITLGGNE
jgi:hypothetical protein